MQIVDIHVIRRVCVGRWWLVQLLLFYRVAMVICGGDFDMDMMIIDIDILAIE